MHIQAVIDRFEGKKAVLLLGDEQQQAVWPRDVLPDEAQAGDYLAITLTIDEAESGAARKEAESLLKELLEKQRNS